MLKADLTKYKLLSRKLKKQLAVLPQEHLHIMNRKSGYHYYQYTPGLGARKLLPLKANREKIKALCQAEYLNKLQDSIEKRIAGIESLLQCFSLSPLDLPSLVPNARKVSFVSPLLPSDAEYADSWQKASYQRMTEPDGPHTTSRGEKVRSKSEVMIAEALNRAGIPYHYEEALRLPDGTTLFPDFHILEPRTRAEFYWEHFGMMDDEEYVQRFVRKMRLYSQNGYCIGKNLIATYETQEEPLGLEEINRLIESLGA